MRSVIWTRFVSVAVRTEKRRNGHARSPDRALPSDMRLVLERGFVSIASVLHRQAKLERHPSVVAHRIRDELVLVNLETNKIFELTPTAARVWDLLDHETDADAILEVLQHEYDVDPDRLARELERTLDSLAENRLIEIGSTEDVR